MTSAPAPATDLGTTLRAALVAAGLGAADPLPYVLPTPPDAPGLALLWWPLEWPSRQVTTAQGAAVAALRAAGWRCSVESPWGLVLVEARPAAAWPGAAPDA